MRILDYDQDLHLHANSLKTLHVKVMTRCFSNEQLDIRELLPTLERSLKEV